MHTKEEPMELDRTKDIENAFRNRYESVLKVAKYARRLNSKRLDEKPESGEEEAPVADKKAAKVVAEALKDVLEGRVEFEAS
jgi:DNA-directed RNA polymerase subunit K/omega